jgi:hypothetical protein
MNGKPDWKNAPEWAKFLAWTKMASGGGLSTNHIKPAFLELSWPSKTSS